ncbi:hypothetical protein BKA62DRAFT_756380, partial [Auriculariales sp. MPI-PUGE-AT-0066]
MPCGLVRLLTLPEIDKGVAQLVLDPARCLELSNAKPDIVVYDGFKIILEGMANTTDGAPWPWKAIPQTILQFAKLVEVRTDHAHEDQTDRSSGYQRSLDIPDKEDASSHQSELTSFVETFFADMQRIIIRLRVVGKTHPAKAFLLTDRVNAILEDESARMQEALLRLQTRFMAYTAYTVESISACVTRIQSTVDTTRAEVQFVGHVVQETDVGVDTIRTTTDTTHAVVTEIRDEVKLLSREKQPTISNRAKLPARPTFFNGRDESVNIIVELIRASTGARIAIMGSGGIGKTSLSLIVIYDERVVGVVGDSRYFVSVEGASDVGAAAQLLAGQLGLPESSDPLSAAISYFETIPRALLVVDNLETLLFTKNAAAQKDTERMLQRLAGIPTLTLIITSRGAVPPNGIRWSYAPSAGLEAISLAAARETFEQIVGQPELASERDALDTLLANVDCMPLAVTLLAQLAQLNNPPSKLLQRWQQKETSFICSDGDDRESSVDVSIQISLDLLKGMRNGPKGQQLLSICAHLLDGLRPSVFDQLDGHFSEIHRARDLLVKFALISVGPEDELKCSVRFDISLLPPGPECGSGVRQSHLIPTSPDQYRGTVSELFDAITAVSEYAYLTVPSTTLREAFCQRLDAHPVWLAPCLQGVARTQLRQNECALAVVNLHAARKLYTTLGDKFQETVCGWLLGVCLRMQDSLEAAERELLAAKDTFIELGDEGNAAQCAQELGAICMIRDDYAQAKIHFTSARDVFKRHGDRLGAAQCTERLGTIQLFLGNFPEADAELQSALAEFEAIADLSGTAYCAVILANLRMRQSDYDSAEKLQIKRREAVLATEILQAARKLYAESSRRVCGRLRGQSLLLQESFWPTQHKDLAAQEILIQMGQEVDATLCRQ